MFKFLFAMLFVVVSVQAQAFPTFVEVMEKTVISQFEGQEEPNNFNFVVGDTNEYKMDMGFFAGKMVMSVREKVAEGVWIDQEVDMVIQKMKIEMLLNPHTGQIVKIIVNGEEQAPPEPGNVDIVEQKETEVTVPAGTYQSVYIKIRDMDKNQDSEVWINSKEVPITGMLKSTQPSQIGKVTLELTSSRRGRQ